MSFVVILKKIDRVITAHHYYKWPCDPLQNAALWYRDPLQNAALCNRKNFDDGPQGISDKMWSGIYIC